MLSFCSDDVHRYCSFSSLWGNYRYIWVVLQAPDNWPFILMWRGTFCLLPKCHGTAQRRTFVVSFCWVKLWCTIWIDFSGHFSSDVSVCVCVCECVCVCIAQHRAWTHNLEIKIRAEIQRPRDQDLNWDTELEALPTEPPRYPVSVIFVQCQVKESFSYCMYILGLGEQP